MTASTLDTSADTASPIAIDPDDAATLSFVLVPNTFCNWPLARPPCPGRVWRDEIGLGTTRQYVLKGLRVTRLYVDAAGLPMVTLTVRDGAPRRVPNHYDVEFLLRIAALANRVHRDRAHRIAYERGGKAINAAFKERKLIEAYYRGRDARHPDENGYPRDDRDRKFRTERQAGKDAFDRLMKRLLRNREDLGDVAFRFKSIRALVRAIGRNPNWSGNFRRVRKSLKLWSDLSIEFPWNHPTGDKKVGYRPWLSIVQDGDAIEIRVSASFMALFNGSYERLTLPLRLTSLAAFNLVMFLAAWRDKHWHSFSPTAFRAFCRRIGIDAATDRDRLRALRSCLRLAGRHYGTAFKTRRHAGKFHFGEISKPMARKQDDHGINDDDERFKAWQKELHAKQAKRRVGVKSV